MLCAGAMLMNGVHIRPRNPSRPSIVALKMIITAPAPHRLPSYDRPARHHSGVPEIGSRSTECLIRDYVLAPRPQEQGRWRRRKPGNQFGASFLDELLRPRRNGFLEMIQEAQPEKQISTQFGA